MRTLRQKLLCQAKDVSQTPVRNGGSALERPVAGFSRGNLSIE